MTEPSADQRRPLNEEELLDLFKHWDTRVAHQELLFIPLSIAGILAIATSWEKMVPLMIVTVAIGSLGIYLFHLFIVRRFAVFQANIFALLESQHLSNWNLLVINPKEVMGIQRLRLLVLPVLSLLWVLALYAKLQNPTPCWWVVIGAVFLVPFVVAMWLWRQTTKAN
ncbi:MAG: hypothetical protein Q8O24_02985 [Gallionellaceae bacterium]|nr:hypothetical protein [Gallionellaceae bacterium]